jgi:molybdenum cofactor biosynthesis enzyme MoaA
VSAARFPEVPSLSLDTLWFQVAGTLCNLACTHCFVSCSPTNHAHEMMTRAEVRVFLDEARALGVREYYFTGGEPFMNPEMLGIAADALAQGPVTILTNGLLLTPERSRRLRELFESSEYSLDVRVSIDGWDAATNDPIRGEGTYVRILEGLRNLAAEGLNPVVTVTEACEGAAAAAGRERFLEWARAVGLSRPRLKVLSLFRIGAEAGRLRGYDSRETLAGRTLPPEALEALQCSSARMVTSRGVYVCPILIDSPFARMGSTLAATRRPFPLSTGACFTCHEYGVTCRT